VHFALAFAVVGALCEGSGILARHAGLERFGSAAMLLGTVAIVLAVGSGYLAANTAPGFTPAAETALADHERVALIAAGTLVLLILWKGLGGGRIAAGQRRAYAAALLGSAALVLWAALLGGRLVYDLAVGVSAAP
jgi:uncharacterized membrane protein